MTSYTRYSIDWKFYDKTEDKDLIIKNDFYFIEYGLVVILKTFSFISSVLISGYLFALVFPTLIERSIFIALTTTSPEEYNSNPLTTSPSSTCYVGFTNSCYTFETIDTNVNIRDMNYLSEDAYKYFQTI